MIARRDIEDTLMRFVEDEFGMARQTFDVTTPLFSSGVLDSFSLMALVAFAEVEFKVLLSAGDIVQDTVDTIASLAALVGSRLAADAGAAGPGVPADL